MTLDRKNRAPIRRHGGHSPSPGGAAAAVVVAAVAAVVLAAIPARAAAATPPAAPQAAGGAEAGSGEADLDLSAYRGRVVLVEFWASWCLPCRDAVPWLGAMASDYGASGLVVIAVNLDQNRADAERFLTTIGGRDLGLRYDPAGKIAERLHIGGMPTELVYDRNGVERFRHDEFRLRQRTQYESELRRLLDEK